MSETLASLNSATVEPSYGFRSTSTFSKDPVRHSPAMNCLLCMAPMVTLITVHVNEFDTFVTFLAIASRMRQLPFQVFVIHQRPIDFIACLVRTLRGVTVDVDPPAGDAGEPAAFVEDTGVRGVPVVRAELDRALLVQRAAAGRRQDLQALPGLRRIERQLSWAGVRVPAVQQVLGIAGREGAVPRAHQRVGRRRRAGDVETAAASVIG